MSRISGWVYTLRALLRRNDADRDMADEIAFHVDRQARKHQESGMEPADARRLALREFGGTTQWREEARRARGSGLLDIAEQDLRQTLRGLRRDPGFASVAVATLALALATNGAMFGVIDSLFLRGPHHVTSPEQLARVYVTRAVPSAKVITSQWQPYVFYHDIRDHGSFFSAVAIYLPGEVRVGVGTESRLVSITYATPDLFSLTGVRPALGRFYSGDEDRPPAGQQVVVLAYSFWQSEFSSDTTILGRTIPLGDGRFRVVGVAPRGFTGVERAPVAAWLPMSARPLAERARAGWTTSWRQSAPGAIVGRLAVPRTLAGEQLTAMLRHDYDGGDPAMRTASVSVRPTSYDMQGAEPTELGVARLLAGVAFLMLLVAAANTTNLTLARALRRQSELAVRVALGAGRSALIRLMVVESVTIALLGGVIGIATAHWGRAIIGGCCCRTSPGAICRSTAACSCGPQPRHWSPASSLD